MAKSKQTQTTSSIQRRQGDIFFESISEEEMKKRKLQKNTNPILAYGEHTGNAHRVISPSFDTLESYVDEQGDIFILSKKEPIVIGHEEHGQLSFPANQWCCISRQREYSPLDAAKERQVAD